VAALTGLVDHLLLLDRALVVALVGVDESHESVLQVVHVVVAAEFGPLLL